MWFVVRHYWLFLWFLFIVKICMLMVVLVVFKAVRYLAECRANREKMKDELGMMLSLQNVMQKYVPVPHCWSLLYLSLFLSLLLLLSLTISFCLPPSISVNLSIPLSLSSCPSVFLSHSVCLSRSVSICLYISFFCSRCPQFDSQLVTIPHTLLYTHTQTNTHTYVACTETFFWACVAICTIIIIIKRMYFVSWECYECLGALMPIPPSQEWLSIVFSVGISPLSPLCSSGLMCTCVFYFSGPSMFVKGLMTCHQVWCD